MMHLRTAATATANHPDSVTSLFTRCQQDFYVYKMCAPSRGSVLTGRYPWHVGYCELRQTVQLVQLTDDDSVS